MNLNVKNELVERGEVSFLELYDIFRPYVVLICAVAMIFGISSYAMTKLFISPTYESSAILIVNNRREVEGEAITNDEITSARNLATVYSLIIKSDAVMQPVIRNSGRDLKTQELARKVSVSPIEETQLFRIAVKGASPQEAYDFATQIVTLAPRIIEEKVEAGSVKVVSQPLMPERPVSPSASKNAIIGCVFGLFIASGFVLAQSFLNRKFQSSEEVEAYLGLPVIGCIPNVEYARKGEK